ncbi:hypothetical protein GQ600_2790 [Phytophthora cactorum]|nr:hypothetical protein GQ600_2790 [Phytophthora cactorum]
MRLCSNSSLVNIYELGSHVVGFTTKTLLKRLDRDPRSLILHFDATYKLNQVPLSVESRTIPAAFTGLSLCCVSARRASLYVYLRFSRVNLRSCSRGAIGRTLRSWRCRWGAVHCDDISVRGLQVGYFNSLYHVIAKVHERSSCIQPGKRILVVTDIFDMHYAKNASEFHAKKPSAVRRWLADLDVKKFWQIFPSAMADRVGNVVDCRKWVDDVVTGRRGNLTDECLDDLLSTLLTDLLSRRLPIVPTPLWSSALSAIDAVMQSRAS